MRRLRTGGPTAGGWHPPDADFLQMIDGCPPAPGLTQWGAYDWRDNFEMWDTFADEPTDRLAPRANDLP